MTTRDECSTRVSSRDVRARSMCGQNACARMSSREVRARSMSSSGMHRCNVLTAAAFAVIAGGGAGGHSQTAKHENWRENCGQRNDWFACHVLAPSLCALPRAKSQGPNAEDLPIARHARLATAF